MNRSGSNKLASSFQKSAKYLNIISTNKFINFNYSSIEINPLPPWYKNHNFYRYPSQIIDILESSGSFQNLLNIYQIRNDSRQGTSCCYSSSRSLFFSLKQTLNTLQGNRLYLDLKRKVKYDLWPETRRGGREEGIYRGILYRERWKDWARLAVARSVPAPAFDIYARYKNGNNQWNQL